MRFVSLLFVCKQTSKQTNNNNNKKTNSLRMDVKQEEEPSSFVVFCFVLFCNDVPTTAVQPGERVVPNPIEKSRNLISFTTRCSVGMFGTFSSSMAAI